MGRDASSSGLSAESPRLAMSYQGLHATRPPPAERVRKHLDQLRAMDELEPWIAFRKLACGRFASGESCRGYQNALLDFLVLDHAVQRTNRGYINRIRP